MIHEIGQELQARLRSRGFGSARVIDREDTAAASGGRERIVIEHSGDDAFASAKKTSPNPVQHYTRAIGGKITIYAQASAKDAAQEYEHRRRAETLLDGVLCAMDYVAGARKNRWLPTGGRFITPEYAEGSARFGGAVYELDFVFDRGVYDIEAEEVEITEGGVDGITVGHQTVVSLAGGEDDDDPTTPPITAEIACGE